ncbi:S9 family peptidase [Halorussus sp. MSC15.2]|uniref:alpha/beta hydrolase family protein n=1 Tax=Halorussus sp. MSC15.2 TaxID=2283638 RepID=UPI0013D76100|nr:S9 family peptidase [Halorussus sp. MSC15.2]NEU58316.1 prolyl oligopeptidase family serine peptidase [Halorussus sp. MSC15.2]
MSDPLELDDFYDLTLLTDLAVSPDGTRVAFVADEFDRAEDERRSSLFVVPADGSRDPHRLSRASDASAPAWSPDGSKLAFTAARDTDAEIEVTRSPDGDGDPESADADTESEDDSRSEVDGDEDAGDGTEDGANDEPKPQVWAFDLELGGDARQLTDFEEGAEGFDWGPAGERLVVAARDPTDDQREYLKHRREEDGPVVTERLQHKFDGRGWLDEVTTYLFVVDYDTRETERLDDAYGGGAREPATGLQPTWSPAGVAASDDSSDGSRIAFLSNRTDRPDDNYVMDVYTVAPDGSDLRKLTDSDLTAGRLRWHPDGDQLAFVGGDPENWYRPSEVFVVEAETGASESWSGDLDRTVARYGRPSWDGDDLLAAVGDEGLTRLARFREDGDPERTFGAQGRDRTVEGFDARGGTAAVVLSDPEDGKDLFTADLADVESGDDIELHDGAGTGEAEPRRLTALNDDLLADRHTPESRRFTFESDGDEVEAIAYFPDDFDPEDPSPRPLVASIHGGPISYDAPTFSFEHAYLTGQGYVVVRTNYRGSSSYGRTFSEQIRGEWGPRETADVLAAVEAAVERGWAAPGRCFATGFSYGGITTGYLVAESDRFAAAAAEHGVYDFRSAFGTDDSHVWWENDFGLPWENEEGYDAASSITDVGEVDTPLLVTAGGEDWRCPPSQSEQLYVSVKKQDVPARLVVYPDEHHNIGDPDRAIHRLRELCKWFERHDPGS